MTIQFLGQIGERRAPRRIVAGLQRTGRQRQAARRLADAEIDAAGRERREQVEVFRDLVRTVVLQHHAARSDPNAPRLREHVRDQDFRRRARERGGVVMFGEPVAVIAGRIGEACERYAARQRVGGGFSGRDGALVEHAQAERQCGQSGQIEVGAEGVERHDEAIGAGRNGLISGFGMPNYFASTFARSNNQEEYRKPKIFVPAAPGLALWSLAARLAARAWSLADGPTRVRSPSRCPRARSDSQTERNHEECE